MIYTILLLTALKNEAWFEVNRFPCRACTLCAYEFSGEPYKQAFIEKCDLYVMMYPHRSEEFMQAKKEFIMCYRASWYLYHAQYFLAENSLRSWMYMCQLRLTIGDKLYQAGMMPSLPFIQ